MNEEKFWQSSLGKWIRNCIIGPDAIINERVWRSHQNMNLPLRFSELCTGHVLNVLFDLIEPEESVDRPLFERRALDFTKTKPDLPAHRIHAFTNLLRNITAFYRAHSLYPILLPEVLRIVEEPIPEKCGHEMHKLLGLLLGAVVHADQRTELLNRLNCISSEEETKIVAELAKITGNKDFLISLKSTPDNPSILDDPIAVRRLFETLIDERNSYAFRLLKMAEELESDEASSTTISSGADFHDQNGHNPSTSSSNNKNDQIQLLREDKENLQKKLLLKEHEIKIANDAAQDYETELNELRNDYNEKSKQLKEANDRNTDLSKELREKNDDIDHLEFECQKLRDAETDRKALLNEKERWNGTKEENEKLKKRLESLEQSIPNLRAESSAYNDLRLKNEALNLELRQLQTKLNNSKQECEEASNRAQKLTEDNEQLLHELKQTSLSCADKSLLFSQGEFNADISLEEQLNRSTIVELEHKLHDMQLELARAAQPEELQRLQKEYIELQNRFADLHDQKVLADEKLQEQSVELKKSADQIRQVERTRVELKTKLVELSVVKAQLQQQEIALREKEFLSSKLKKHEETLKIQTEQISKESTRCLKLEAQLQQREIQSNDRNHELEEMRHEILKIRTEHDGCSRLRKSLESECLSLRKRIEELEEQLSQSKLNSHGSDAMRKRLNSAEQSLLEKQNALNELENDNQNLKQHAEIATSKVQKLREDLLSERTRLSDLLSRLRSICASCRLKSNDQDQRLNNEEMLKDDNIMINTIDSLLLSAFTTARSEADSLRVERQVQLEEINELRRNIEDLKQTHSQLDINGDITHDKMRNKMCVLQERLNASLTRENELTAEIQASKRTVEDLQRQLQQNVKTSGELSRLRINQHDFEQEIQSLKDKISINNKERSDLNSNLNRLQNTHQAQQNEIERLTKLNESLAIDFDRYRFENNELKRKLELLTDINKSTASRQTEFKELEDGLSRARSSLKSERDRLIGCEQNLSRVTRELNETRRDYAALLRQKDTTSEELAQLCEANSAQKSALTNLNLTIQQLNNALLDKDNELANFRKEIETLREYNSDENKLLVRQIEMLMKQNQDLHKRSDNFYVEQKDLQEKLIVVRRHKEKLEEKLMEQYKQQVESLRKPEKTTLVKRAARALNLKSPSRKITTTTTLLHEKASGSEDSSIYSADEGFLASPPQQTTDLIRPNDNLLVQSTGQFSNTNSPTLTLSHANSDPTSTQSLISTTPSTSIADSIEENCRSTPVCSSSDRGSGGSGSPDYDQIHFGVHHSKKGSIDSQQSCNYASIGAMAPFRQRNTRIGGSLRCPQSFRPNAGNWRIPTSIEEDMISLQGSERSIDVTPLRLNVQRNGTGSIRSSTNKLPPPYISKQQTSRPPPPSYTSSRTCLTPPVKLRDFSPIDASTPKSDYSNTISTTAINTTPLKCVPKEGEFRQIQLDPMERQAKAQSFYDNHNSNSNQLLIVSEDKIVKKPSINNNEGWVGYGCV